MTDPLNYLWLGAPSEVVMAPLAHPSPQGEMVILSWVLFHIHKTLHDPGLSYHSHTLQFILGDGGLSRGEGMGETKEQVRTAGIASSTYHIDTSCSFSCTTHRLSTLYSAACAVPAHRPSSVILESSLLSFRPLR